MSYQLLEKTLGFEETLPVTEKWSACADFLQLLADYCLRYKPETIVECSSGTSSLVLAQCCRINGCGHVYSLENGEEYANSTRQQLEDFSLSAYADILYSPLKTWDLDREEYQWYELDRLPMRKIDLLVIDGPPGFLQKYSRYPALPLLSDRLSAGCTVFLDDAAREDEKEIVRRWLEAFPEFRAEYIENERGCSILKR